MEQSISNKVSSEQVVGIFDKKIKQKIATEEFVQSELEYQLQQHDKKISIRVILFDALFQRPNHAVSGFWYEFTEEIVWVFGSFQILKRLDQNLFSLFTKIVVDTIFIHLENQNKTILDCEKEAFKRYMDDMNRIHATKAIAIAERLKQVLFLLVNQFYRTKNYPILNTKNIIPLNDNQLYETLNASFNRIKNKKQIVGTIKLRMIPYIFQDVYQSKEENNSNPLRLKVAHSIISKNQGDTNLFSIILFTSQFIELLTSNSNLLDYILAYEIISIENALKFNRGLMEQEILSIVSRDVDASERALYGFYTKEEIQQAKLELENYFSNLLFEKKVPILRIVD